MDRVTRANSAIRTIGGTAPWYPCLLGPAGDGVGEVIGDVDRAGPDRLRGDRRQLGVMTGDGGQHGRLPGEDGDALGGAQREAERLSLAWSSTADACNSASRAASGSAQSSAANSSNAGPVHSASAHSSVSAFNCLASIFRRGHLGASTAALT